MALVIPKSNGSNSSNNPLTIPATQEQQPPSIINLAVASDTMSNESAIEPTKDLAVAITSELVKEQPASQLDLVIESNLANLINKLESSVPDIRTEMITIHKALAKDPAQVTILTQAQQAAIFAGYSKLTGIELVAKAAAKRGSKTPVSLEMFE